MAQITQLLQQIESGDQEASLKLLPQVYEELRQLARIWMAKESPDHTLQPTALVHEAYLRLVEHPDEDQWNSRGHFFGAAAEAMRRILVENARQKQQLKRGGEFEQVPFDLASPELTMEPDQFLEFNECLEQLEVQDVPAANLVKLRYIVGLTMQECADTLNLPLRTTERLWTFAKTWLFRELRSVD